MKHDDKNGPLFLAGVLLAVAIGLAGYFVSQTLYNAKVGINTAEVKGLAERRVTADRANWDIVFKLAVNSRDQLSALYGQAESQQQMIADMLRKNGFIDEDIAIGALDYEYYEYRDDGQRLVDQSHVLRGTVSLDTAQVNKIQDVRKQVSKLIAQGVNIESRTPMYRFTGLNEIKPDMLREATTNARLAANEFAENAGVSVGGIRSARQGGFIIRDAGEEYGDTAKIEKDVRVVTTIDFYLTD